MQCRDGRVTDAEQVHRPGLGVLRDNVELTGQSPDEIHAARILEVDADAALTHGVAQVGRADPAALPVGHRGQRRAAGIPAVRRFDLDHVRAEPGEQLGRERQCLHLFQREDAHTGQGHRRAGVGCVRHGRDVTTQVSDLIFYAMRYARFMRGVLGWGGYLPYRRLDRSTISPVAGSGGGHGTRTVAGPDENSTTMAVAAARLALAADAPRPRALWFATTEPPYLDKTNATAVHAALRLDRDTAAYD